VSTVGQAETVTHSVIEVPTTYLWRTPVQYPEEWIVRLRCSGESMMTLRDVLELLPPVLRHVELDFRGQRHDLDAWDCLPNNTGLPLVRLRVANLLRTEAAHDLHFIPATVITREGPCASVFRLAYLRRTVAALECSDASPADKPHPLAHRLRSLGSNQIARDADDPSQVIVSDELARKVRAL